MCRFFGFSSKKADPIIGNNFKKILSFMKKGGPDNQGIYLNSDNTLGLGHQRLSIIDLEERSNQPFWDESRRYCILYNGEIYNYKELRKEFETRGEKFQTDSDTEVLMKGFLKDGDAFLNKCHGMWAFALYDSQLKTLILVRDRFGVKPLYYLVSESHVVFSSEFKVFSSLENHLNLQICRNAVQEYLEFGYVAAPRTFYSDAKKLFPGHCLKINLVTHESVNQQWYVPQLKERIPEHELDKCLENALLTSMSLRLVADVPIGMFLSGGVDSTLVASLVAALGVKLDAFSIGFEPNSFDETLLAEKTAKYLGHNFHRIILGPKEVEPLIDELDIDEPVCDVSIIPTYLLSKHVSRSFKVALSGDGGDEVFGGYTNYLKVNRANSFAKGLSHLDMNFMKSLKDRVNHKLPLKVAKTELDLNYSGLFDSSRRYLPRSVVKSLTRPDELLPWNSKSNVSTIQEMMNHDFKYFMVDDVLAKVDRCSMQASIELREPLLDQNVVELGQQFSENKKFFDSYGKHPLRKILSRYIPTKFFDHPKRGLGIPFREWMNSGGLKWSQNIVRESSLLDDVFLDRDTIEFYLKDSTVNKELQSNITMSLYFLVRWRIFQKQHSI